MSVFIRAGLCGTFVLLERAQDPAGGGQRREELASGTPGVPDWRRPETFATGMECMVERYMESQRWEERMSARACRQALPGRVAGRDA